MTDKLDPSSTLVVVTGVCAMVVVVQQAAWRLARGVVTIVHEGGHAVAALMSGRRLTGIRLHSDTSGVTLSIGKPTGPGMVATVAAGYVSPSLVGLAGVGLLAMDQVTVMLWAGTALLLGMLLMIRNLYGALSLLVTGAALVAISLYASAELQAAFGYGIVWFLLLGGVRPVGELYVTRRRLPGRRTDADQLARITHLPATMWVLLFALTTLGALAAGGWLLLT
ncbi:MAG TPA: M50 family metallopeptidase [Acidimicrobiales bacterium]|jgi:hypothetical protein